MENTMTVYNDDIARLKDLKQAAGQPWAAIDPEYAARMRAQNQFKTGLDIARYTAAIMRKDMHDYDQDSADYTQSLGCWHGFIAQQKMIAVKKHHGTTDKRYIYLSGWMVAALRSEFGPLPDLHVLAPSGCTRARPSVRSARRRTRSWGFSGSAAYSKRSE
jgi:isocitrate lyase